MATESFTGEFSQRIDGKGRVSIPAKFRRVLEKGDPNWHEGLSTCLRLNYGDHLESRLEGYTVATYLEIEARINDWHPVDEEEEADKEASEFFMLTQSDEIEVDRDGRIVLPARYRAKLGIEGGELVFAGKGDRFEIWSAVTYEAEVGAKMRAYLASRPKNYKPMTKVWARSGRNG